MQRLIALILVLGLNACGAPDETSDRTSDETSGETSGETSSSPAPIRLDGSQWVVTEYRTESGELAGVMKGSELTMTFGADGRVTGSAGCNSYFASYALQADGVRFGLPGATRMFCGEPAGLMDQEFRFLSLLEKVAGLRLEGGNLSLMEDGGQPVLVLAPLGNL